MGKIKFQVRLYDMLEHKIVSSRLQQWIANAMYYRAIARIQKQIMYGFFNPEYESVDHGAEEDQKNLKEWVLKNVKSGLVDVNTFDYVELPCYGNSLWPSFKPLWIDGPCFYRIVFGFNFD